MIKRKLICTNPIHGDDGRIWESKQQGDLAEVSCSKQGGTGGCGQKGFVKIHDPKGQRKKMMTGGSFAERVKERQMKDTQEEKTVRSVSKETKKVSNNVSLLIDDFMIDMIHQGIVDFLQSALNMDLNYNAEAQEMLRSKAREVVKLLTYETTPMSSYLITWAIIILPAFMKKYLGGLFGGKEEKKVEEKT